VHCHAVQLLQVCCTVFGILCMSCQMRCCVHYAAGVLYHLYGVNLDSGLPAAYSDKHWQQVLDHLQLRPQQVRSEVVCLLFCVVQCLSVSWLFDMCGPVVCH
jgi:hypothetical protein